MSKSTTPARPTRQLLDELDALMEKMLTLPVEDDVPPLPSPSPRAKIEPVRNEAKIEPRAEAAAAAVAATLTLFGGTRSADRAAFEVGAVETDDAAVENAADDAQPVSAEDLIDPPEETVDDKREELAGPHLTRWRAFAKNRDAERGAASETDTEEDIEYDAEYDSETESPEDEEENLAMEEFTLPEPPPVETNERSGLYNAGLTWEAGFRRWTRPLGWAVNSPQGRMAMGIVGLAMWLAAAAWLVRDWMQWPH